jgi:hypothetical protein
MKSNHARVTTGLFVAVLGAGVGLMFGACGDSADDCNNTRSCKPPPCNMDAGVDGSPLDGVDAGCCLQSDGGEVCEQS